MPCHVSIHPKLPVVECVFFDAVSCYEFIAGMEESIKHGTTSDQDPGGKKPILVDCFTIKSDCTSTDLFFALEALSQCQGNALRKLRQAVILPAAPAAAAHFHFWETLCYNRGYPIRSFSERRPALGWLAQHFYNSSTSQILANRSARDEFFLPREEQRIAYKR